jgi:competence protein ComEC
MALAWLAAAWITGIAAAAIFGLAAWPVAFTIAAVGGAIALVRRDRTVAVAAVALAAIFAGAVLRFETDRPHVAADDVSHYNDGVDMRVRGVVRDDPEVGDESQRFSITVRAIEIQGEWQPQSGGVLVRAGYLPRYHSGDVVEIEGKFQSPFAGAGFDYADYLARKDIRSTMEFPLVRITGHEDDGIMRTAILHVRRRLSKAIGLSLPEPQSSLAQGILLGQKSVLPADVAADLNDTNTSHLVVVSGANVVLVSAFATGALSWLFGRRRALGLSIGVVIAYGLLIGMSPSVARGTVMGVLLIIATLAGRPASGLVSILFAAAVMMGIDPSVSRDISFQLSFAATAGVVYLASPIRAWMLEWCARLLRQDTLPSPFAWIAEPISVTVAAVIATEPLIAMNFGRVSLVALPANVLVVPAFGLILLTSLLAAVAGLLPFGRLLFAAPGYYSLSYWIAVTHWLAAVPGASATIRGYTTWWAVSTYIPVTIAAFAALRIFRLPIGSRIEPMRLNVARLVGAGVIAVPAAVIVATAGLAFWPTHGRRLQVTVLDIGQGDAILIETPGGHDILVDAGPGRAVLRGLGDELSWRDRSIEMVLVTHPQADHITGLIDVLARYDVRRVLAGPGVENSLAYRTFAAAVRNEGRTLETAEQGGSFDLGDGVMLEILGPGDEMAQDPQVNNTGAVVRLSWRGVSFLLTADIEAKAERSLISDGVSLEATVLKVPHHGSATSSSREFLDAVRPSIAVVSTGQNNRFGLPSPGVVARIGEYAPVLNTADSGSVHFETDGAHVWVSTSR